MTEALIKLDSSCQQTPVVANRSDDRLLASASVMRNLQ